MAFFASELFRRRFFVGELSEFCEFFFWRGWFGELSELDGFKWTSLYCLEEASLQ